MSKALLLRSPPSFALNTESHNREHARRDGNLSSARRPLKDIGATVSRRRYSAKSAREIRLPVTERAEVSIEAGLCHGGNIRATESYGNCHTSNLTPYCICHTIPHRQ